MSHIVATSTKRAAAFIAFLSMTLFLGAACLLTAGCAGRSATDQDQAAHLLAKRENILEDLQSPRLVADVRKLQLFALELHTKRQAALAFVLDTKKFTETEGQVQAAKLIRELKDLYDANFALPMLPPGRAKALEKLLECDGPLTSLGKRPPEDYDPYYDVLFLLKEAPLSVRNFPLDNDAFHLFNYNKKVVADNGRIAGLSAQERKAIELTNEYRMLLGMRALLINKSLVRTAQQHSREMRDRNYYGHVSPDEKFQTLPQRAAHFGYPQAGLGENIANGQKSPEKVHAFWLNCGPDNRNELQPHYLDIGLGEAGILWAEVFGAGRAATDRSKFTEEYFYIPVGEGEIALMPFKDDFALFAHRQLQIDGTAVEIKGRIGTNGDLDLRGNTSIKGDAFCGGSANVAQTVKIDGKRRQLLGYHLLKPADTVVGIFKAKNDNHVLPGEPTTLVVEAGAARRLPSGNYYFESVSLGANSKLVIEGKVVIFTSGHVELRRGRVINKTNQAGNFAIISSERGRGTVYLPQTGVFSGCVYAPGATIAIEGDGLEIDGALIGDTIRVRGKITLTHNYATTSVRFWFPRIPDTKEGQPGPPPLDEQYPLVKSLEIEPSPAEPLFVGESRSYKVHLIGDVDLNRNGVIEDNEKNVRIPLRYFPVTRQPYLDTVRVKDR